MNCLSLKVKSDCFNGTTSHVGSRWLILGSHHSTYAIFHSEFNISQTKILDAIPDNEFVHDILTKWILYATTCCGSWQVNVQVVQQAHPNKLLRFLHFSFTLDDCCVCVCVPCLDCWRLKVPNAWHAPA